MSDGFIGEIRLFAFEQFPLANFLPCNGQLLPRFRVPAFV